MSNLVILLLFVFAGVALMVVLGERFAKPADPEQQARLQRWIMPLLLLAAFAGAIQHYFG
jgi:hypothetical protein